MNVLASAAFIMGPADFTIDVKVAGRFASGVFPEIVKGRVATVGVAGVAVAAASSFPDQKLPGIVADCVVRSKTQRVNYWSGTEPCSASMRRRYYFVNIFALTHNYLEPQMVTHINNAKGLLI